MLQSIYCLRQNFQLSISTKLTDQAKFRFYFL